MFRVLANHSLPCLLIAAIALTGVVPPVSFCGAAHDRCVERQCCCGCCSHPDDEAASCCSSGQAERTCRCSAVPETPAVPDERPTLPERHELNGVEPLATSSDGLPDDARPSRLAAAECLAPTPHLPQPCVLCRWLA